MAPVSGSTPGYATRAPRSRSRASSATQVDLVPLLDRPEERHRARPGDWLEGRQPLDDASPNAPRTPVDGQRLAQAAHALPELGLHPTTQQDPRPRTG